MTTSRSRSWSRASVAAFDPDFLPEWVDTDHVATEPMDNIEATYDDLQRYTEGPSRALLRQGRYSPLVRAAAVVGGVVLLGMCCGAAYYVGIYAYTAAVFLMARKLEVSEPVSDHDKPLVFQDNEAVREVVGEPERTSRYSESDLASPSTTVVQRCVWRVPG